MVSRPFKKDLTPIGKGGITKHAGKGARETSSGNASALTRGSPFGGNSYPKPPPPTPAPSPFASNDMAPPPMSDNDADDLE